MSELLKPCPFCGGFAEDVMRTGAIVCTGCDASAPNKLAWNTRAAPKVKPLVWDRHPDDEQFYAFQNDDGDCLYVVDRLDSGRWRLYIGGELVMDRDDPDRVMKWEKCQHAMSYAQNDLDGRLSRILSALDMEG